MSVANELGSDRRPGLAIVANCLTPYRVHLHRVLAEGLPELALHTLVTHGAGDFDWKLKLPPEIHAEYFGAADETPVARLHESPLKEWRKGGRLLEHMARHDVRAAIIGLPRYMSYLRVLLEGARRGRPVFVNSDANLENERSLGALPRAVKRGYHGWWIRRAAGVMPMGRDGEAYFAKYGAAAERMYRLPYWPDYEHFSAVPAGGLDDFRGRYGLSAGRRYFLFSGRLAPIKRVDLLVSAFHAIAARRPDWDLLIVGDGSQRAALERQVPMEQRPRVKWVGFLEADELPVAYHAADVLVLPSDREPWAVVVQEALSAGLPVVASDVVGAAREIVRGGVGGRIFRAGDVDSLAAAMLEISAPAELASQKEQARTALAEWRRRNDPVSSVRRALVDFGVLKSLSPTGAAGAAVPTS